MVFLSILLGFDLILHIINTIISSQIIYQQKVAFYFNFAIVAFLTNIIFDILFITEQFCPFLNTTQYRISEMLIAFQFIFFCMFFQKHRIFYNKIIEKIYMIFTQVSLLFIIFFTLDIFYGNLDPLAKFIQNYANIISSIFLFAIFAGYFIPILVQKRYKKEFKYYLFFFILESFGLWLELIFNLHIMPVIVINYFLSIAFSISFFKFVYFDKGRHINDK